MPRKSVRAASSRLVVATGNAGKLQEFRALLAELPFVVVGQREAGVIAPEENGASYLANALLKARHAAAATGAAVIADDSGLEVDALDNEPGIHSARYAGPGAGDAANNAKLLAALDGVPPPLRTARYRCVLVYLAAPQSAVAAREFAPDASPAAPIIAEGVWEGHILEAPRGRGGFGYDPYFWLAELNLSAAELPPEEKNRLSHRGRALRVLREALLREVPARGGTGAEGGAPAPAVAGASRR